jgi:hypothetical protein
MTTQTRSIPFGKFVQAGLIGGATAVVINLILLFVGQTINGGSLMISPPGATAPQALPFTLVILLSLVPGLVAGLLYAVFKRFMANPRPVFLIVAAVVFVLFLFGPLSSAQSNVAKWILEMMHVGAAIPIVAFILRADR